MPISLPISASNWTPPLARTHYYRHSPLGEKLDTTDFPWPLPSSKQQ